MVETIFLLLVISTGFSAYMRGRREGTWSWRIFAKTIFGIWVLGAVVGGLGVWLGRIMGPEHALLVTGLVVVVIAIGVLFLTLWVCGRTGGEKQ
jgi:uncharacterized membrane protein YfcA